MTTGHARRIDQALKETIQRLVKVEAQKTFDQHQEADKQKEIKFLSGHILKLADMAVSA